VTLKKERLPPKRLARGRIRRRARPACYACPTHLAYPAFFKKKKSGPHATLRLHVSHALLCLQTRPCMLVHLHMQLCTSCMPMHISCLLAVSCLLMRMLMFQMCLSTCARFLHMLTLQHTSKTDEIFINIFLQYICIAITTSR
jgi:hypothetical protein